MTIKLAGTDFVIKTPSDYAGFIKTTIDACIEQQTPDVIYLLRPIVEGELPKLKDLAFEHPAEPGEMREWISELRDVLGKAFRENKINSQIKEIVLTRLEIALSRLQDIPCGRQAFDDTIAFSDLLLNIAHDFDTIGAKRTSLENRIILKQLGYASDMISLDCHSLSGIAKINDLEKYGRVLAREPGIFHKSIFTELDLVIPFYHKFRMAKELSFCVKLLRNGLDSLMDNSCCLVNDNGNVSDPREVLKYLHDGCRLLGKYYTCNQEHVKAAGIYSNFIKYCEDNFPREQHAIYSQNIKLALEKIF